MICCGHSFGAASMLKLGSIDERVKCILTLDPWIFPIYKEINSGNFGKFPASQPLLLLNTSSFHDINNAKLKGIWDTDNK